MAEIEGASVDRLHSGRHGLTAEAVAASQRGRLLDAVLEVAADHGYDATTVTEIVARARVSRRTFYEQFPDKRSCFLAAYDRASERLLSSLRSTPPDDAGRRWRERVGALIEVLVTELTARPEDARALLVEVFAAGPEAVRRRAAHLEAIASLLRAVHEEARVADRRIGALPDQAFSMLAAGVEELIRAAVAGPGSRAQPADLVEPAARVALALLGRREPPRVAVRWDTADPGSAEEIRVLPANQ